MLTERITMIKNDSVYHRHCFEVVVPEEELMLQLRYFRKHDNLMKLLVYGRMLSDFEIRLMRASLKFELIGNFVYPVNNCKIQKPHAKVYMKELFQGFYETADEVRDQIEAITGEFVSEEFTKKVFRKLAFIINTCCPMMSDTFEIWPEHTYRCFIEYAIDNDDFNFPDNCSISKLFPETPCYGSLRTFVLEGMPEDFVKKVCHDKYDDCYEHIKH